MVFTLKQKHLAIKTQKTIKSHMADKVDNMKKIKLTEADLTRIIQRIIKEDDSEMYTNYMFFSNLEQIKRQCEKLLSLDKSMIDGIIQNGHDWADDHITEAKNNMDQVFDFFMGKVDKDSMEMDEWIMRVPTDETLEEEKEMCEECWNEEELEEKWAGKSVVKKTGEYSDKTIAELKSKLKKLKSNPEKTEALKKKERQLIFAIRAKGGWKKGKM
jgi:hypothetical protein